MKTNIFAHGFLGMADNFAGQQPMAALSSDVALAVRGQKYSWFRQGLGEEILPMGKRRKAPSLFVRFCLILQ